jgi:hypothetical protein
MALWKGKVIRRMWKHLAVSFAPAIHFVSHAGEN